MHLSRWIRSIFSLRKRPVRRKTRAYRPFFEALEDRVVPTLTAYPDSIAVLHGQTASISLLAHLSDPTINPANITIVQWPTQAYFIYNSTTGVCTYSASNSSLLPDSFRFKGNDGNADSNTATISINVTNTAPVARNDGAYAVHIGETLVVSAANGLFRFL